VASYCADEDSGIVKRIRREHIGFKVVEQVAGVGAPIVRSRLPNRLTAIDFAPFLTHL
jgi:hypothetical protein